MKTSSQTTLLDLLLALREQMVQYNRMKDYAALNRIFVTFATLSEALSWHKRREQSYGVDLPVYLLLDQLASYAREAGTGVAWKAELPSVEAIKAAFNTDTEDDSYMR